MTVTPVDVPGYFKVTYTDRVVTRLIPDSEKFHKLFKLATPTKQFGLDFRAPVQLTKEGGFTSNLDNTAFDLNQPKSHNVPEAKMTSSTLVQRSAMSYDTMQRALHALKVGGPAGQEAFVNATKAVVAAQVKTCTFVAELQYRYGCGDAANDAPGATDNLGEVESVTVAAAGGVVTLRLTDASWATAIWAASEGFRYDFRDGAGAQVAPDFPVLTSVLPSTRDLVFTGTQAELAAIAGGDHIYFAGDAVSAYEKEMVGLSRIMENTGVLFGIDVNDFNLWGAHQFDTGAQPLTMGLVLEGAQRCANLGYSGDLCLMVNPATWADLMQDEAALVDHTGGKKSSYARGSSTIAFRGLTGNIKVESDIYMKRGIAYMAPPNGVLRLGANEGTFKMPTGEDRRMMREMENKAGTEVRYYWNKSIYSPTPAYLTKFENIVNATPAA